MHTFIKNIAAPFAATIAAFAFLGLFVYLLHIGVQRNEVHECLVWQQQSKDFAHFYATSWQVEQCAAHGITL